MKNGTIIKVNQIIIENVAKKCVLEYLQWKFKIMSILFKLKRKKNP